MATYSPQSLGIKTPSGGFQQGGWYSGRQYWGGTLSDPGVIHPSSNQSGAGQAVSNEVVSQTNPNNVSYLQTQKVNANQIQSPVKFSLPSTTAQGDYISSISNEAEKAKQALQDSISSQKAEVDTRLDELRKKEQETLGKVGDLVTPFREDLEKTERERLYINKNFEENQVLIDELDTLLTEGNELIRQQQEVTGIAAIRNPRIQKTMEDVAARAGVIQAVINARNGQIAVAENMIDRSINAIVADRQDQIAYYETILNLNRQDILSLDQTSKKLAQEQLDIKKNDLNRANATVDYIKQLLIDPATASLMGEAGVKLNDSIEQINTKLSNATYAREVKDMSNEMVLSGAQAVVNPNDVPKDELRVLTDSRGQKHYYRVEEKTDGRVGTASERMVNTLVERLDTSGDSFNSFDEIVVAYANQMSLDEIYNAYEESIMGQKWGRPVENPNEIALLYKWARGEITEAEYRAAMEG